MAVQLGCSSLSSYRVTQLPVAALTVLTHRLKRRQCLTQGGLLEYILHVFFSTQNFCPFSHTIILVGSQGHLFGALDCQPSSLFCTLFLAPQLQPSGAFLAGPWTLWLYSQFILDAILIDFVLPSFMVAHTFFCVLCLCTAFSCIPRSACSFKKKNVLEVTSSH